VIKEYFESKQRNKDKKNFTNLIPPSIIASSILVASSIIFPYQHVAAYSGFVISGAIIAGSFVYNKIQADKFQ
jgi:hypothetical protein